MLMQNRIPKPDGIVAELLHDRHEHRHGQQHDADPVHEHAEDQEHQHHGDDDADRGHVQPDDQVGRVRVAARQAVGAGEHRGPERHPQDRAHRAERLGQRLAEHPAAQLPADRDEDEGRDDAHGRRLGDAGHPAVDRAEHEVDDDQRRQQALGDGKACVVAELQDDAQGHQRADEDEPCDPVGALDAPGAGDQGGHCADDERPRRQRGLHHDAGTDRRRPERGRPGLRRSGHDWPDLRPPGRRPPRRRQQPDRPAPGFRPATAPGSD